MEDRKVKIGVVGLGYVGLPLASLFASEYSVIGYDYNARRVSQIRSGVDLNAEVSDEALGNALQTGLHCTSDASELSDCDFIIVAVPTPVDADNNPDLTPLKSATATVGKVMKKGCTVVYESTVAPGTTEDVCVPILEKESGLKFNVDFFVGYSPERVNPGDTDHSVKFIRKIVSGSTEATADALEKLYNSVLATPTFRATSIKVAEAAKIIENTQRDVNIALINELTRIFNAMGINTNEVIEAAATKWNFHAYRPGLVGGHCIGVDPYYLIRKAEESGVDPRVIRTARNANEEMAYYLVDQTIAAIKAKGISPAEANVLVLGFAFKPDCPDIRNTKCYNVYRALKERCRKVTVFDPVVNPQDVAFEYGDVEIITDEASLKAAGPFDAMVRCTIHKKCEALPLDSVLSPGAPDISLVNEKASPANL